MIRHLFSSELNLCLIKFQRKINFCAKVNTYFIANIIAGALQEMTFNADVEHFNVLRRARLRRLAAGPSRLQLMARNRHRRIAAAQNQ